MPSESLVPVSQALVHVSSGEKETTELPLEPPHPEIEVVTEEEKRHEEQLRSKAETPREYLKTAPAARPALTQGASVSCKTMLGFLEALETILPRGTGNPSLEAARVWFDENDPERLFIEASTGSVWSTVAVKAKQAGDTGFSMIMPVRWARNVLRAVREKNELIVIGADDLGVCIGNYTIPFAARAEEFPTSPAIGAWIARAVMPAFYVQEICDRVLPARSQEVSDIALQRVLLDFEHCQDEHGNWFVLCTAVATEGTHRFHILRLPQMHVQMADQARCDALPPTCTVDAGFFRYLQEIVEGQMFGFEFSPKQIAAKGNDFIVMATTSELGSDRFGDLVTWRKFDISYPGYWLVDSKKLLEALDASEGDTTSLHVDGLRETMRVVTTGHQSRHQQELDAQCFNGPPIGDVLLEKSHLVEAVACCNSGLLRIEMANCDTDRESMPIVLRGKDEQFKAILLPKQ